MDIVFIVIGVSFILMVILIKCFGSVDICWICVIKFNCIGVFRVCYILVIDYFINSFI